MKSVKTRIITVAILALFLFLPLNTVFAKTSIEASLTTNAYEIKKNEEVIITLRFDNFNEIKKGINAYKATLEYDSKYFEEVLASDFSTLNNWESLKYNPITKEFVSFHRVGVKEATDIVQIKLKAKENIEATESSIKIKDIVVSEGKNDINLKDKEIEINLVKEQNKDEIPTENPSNSTNTIVTDTRNTYTSGKYAGIGTVFKKTNSSDLSNKNEELEEIDKDNTSENTDNKEIEDKSDNNEDKVLNEKEKVEKSRNWYVLVLLLALIEATLLWYYFKRKHNKNDKISTYFMFITSGLIYLQFIGAVFATTFNIALLGELNGDARVNYADASLLELHLINLKKLPDEKLEYADMNGDKKITVTDLSLLIHKIENILDYDVTITNIEPENAYPNKNQEVLVQFNADVSYGANIQKIVMNNQEYNVEKDPTTSLYTFKINSGNVGIKDYNITEAYLDNNKKVKIDYSFKIDVLKDIPVVENYHVEENKDDSKLNLLFNVIDNNDSMEDSYVEVYDENQNLVTTEKVAKGENNIELQVEEKKEYIATIILNYNLSNNPEDQEHKGVNSYEKELQLVVDYNFNITNIKTYKEDQETTIFNKEDQVKLAFESTNTTRHIPTSIKVGEKEYEVVVENNKYVVTLDAITDLGSQTITIDEVILSNGKKFELNENNTVAIQVDKRKPEVIDLATTEFTEMNQLKVMFKLDDPDEAVTKLNIQVLDADDNEIGSMVLSRNDVLSDGMVSKFFHTRMTTKYKRKVFYSYNVTGNADDTVTNELAKETSVEADPRITINSITPNKNYVEKGGALKLTFDLESNKEEDITRILINNTNYIAVKLDNGNYEVTLNVGHKSGIYPLTITKFTYSNGEAATTDKTVNVEVLKEKPEIINFLQTDNLNTKEVILSFDVLDKENTFISGKALLTIDGNTEELEVKKGYNELTFQVEPSRKYTLDVKVTYDLDSNTSTDSEEDNRVTEVLITKEIELIADYELNIGNIKTYNDNGETKYFGKSEPIQVSFESTNTTNFEPIKAVVNGIEYPLTKKDGAYYLTISSHRTSGVKTAKIEKITLNNSKELIMTENNEFKVTVLKDKPTVEQFGYKENMDATISASFKVIDEEEAISGGKVVVLKNGSVVKEQDLEKDDNTITFMPEENQNYVVKVIADYDLDMNVLESDANEYKDVTLLEADITLGARKFEMKDIIRTSVYKQTDDGVIEVSTLKESDLTNLDNYIAKVYLKEMPTFYTTITGYRIEDNELKLTLDYDNVVLYTGESKQDKLEIVFGKMNDGVAENITLEGLIREMEANPTGTFTLTRDYDASIITKNSNALISTSFMGTLNGNGHKIYNLSKPLFDTIESATIENLTLESPKLSGVNSRGTLANIATNADIRNVHVKDLTMITGTNRVGGIVGESTATNIEQSSVTNFQITTSLHIRVAGIVGNMIGGSIKNCYVEGDLNSTQNKDGNGISGILGTGEGAELITIENCISKVTYTNNVSARLNGDIVGLALNNNTILKNNISLSTGNNFYSIHGSSVHATSTNNYELTDSGLISNASGDRVKQVAKEELTTEFFKDNANFDETIWDLANVSYDKPPVLQVTKVEKDETDEEKPSNNKLYIPDYSRIKKINGYTEAKDILYHNINKLMPYYDAKYLIEDGLKIQNDNILNTKIIKHIIPYSNGKMLTYLTKENNSSITSIKVVFDDLTVSEYPVTFKELKQDIAIYSVNGLDIDYAYNNYVIKDDASIVETLENYINSVDYTTILDPLTASADSRLYRDHYIEKMKPMALVIALQLLQNDSNSVLTLDNDILNNKIKQELIDSGRINKILYAYNYLHRWYQFEIGGSKVSDIFLFEGKMYKDSMTLDNLTEEVLTGNLATNSTANFFASSLSKYTGSSALTYYLDGVIKNIGGYEDINDWFTEHFSSIGILSEIPVKNHPEVKYRAWDRMKGFPNFILPLSTLPKYAGYIISGPAQFQMGAQRTYIKDPTTPSGQNTVRNIVNAHSALVKRQFDTLAGSFHVESWNNFTILVYDTVKTITGYKTSYLPGTNIPIGTKPITTMNRVGTSEPYHKNFNEAVGAWQYGSAAGVGNTAGFLWFIATAGLTNYDTWTHEFQHALADKIMLFRGGMRMPMETYTQGNVEQRDNWSNNNIQGYDVGPYYFNLAFTLNRESLATQNLTPERIDTREKLENYYKGQLDALELLDYASAKAFIKLTPEEQAKIATRMNQSAGYSSWGTITTEQAEAMNLTSLESLWDNRIILRPNNAWGVSVRGLTPINSIGADDYGYESIWVTRWYMGHYDNGYSDAFSNKKNMFEMLGYGGVNGYVTYASRRSSSDLDAIQKITLAKTGTAMNWKEYRMSRYAEIESKQDNKYINMDLLIEQFVNALRNDAKNGNRNITNATNLRKIYYHYLKRATNDFVTDPLGTDLEMTHIKTAEELVTKINAKPYGYYILDNDIDFSGISKNVTQTFMGKLDGNGHKIIGNTVSIFQKIRFGYVKDLVLERTNIPMSVANAGALSTRTEYSVLENVKAIDLQLNFGGRNDLSLIGGAVGTTTSSGIEVETLKNKITSIEDFQKINENPGGIFELEADLDFAGYTGTGSVITTTFTGKLDGKGHTIYNLTNMSLFNTITGTVENLNIQNFSNIASATTDDVTAFAKLTNGATIRNIKFSNITLEGRHRVATVTGFDNANSTFENISVKNVSVKGSGVYVSTFIGRKYSGIIRNVFVEGNMEITTTENGGIVGAFQKGGTMENVISKVDIHKTGNTYNPVDKSEYNGGIVGNIYDNPIIKNSIAFGNMKGFTNSEGVEKIPYKVTGAAVANILTSMENVYEYKGSQGSSSIIEETASKIKEATEEQIHTMDFYKEILHFDEAIWNLDSIIDKGYPELR